MDGTALVTQINRRLMIDLKLSGGETISGFFLHQIGRMARAGDALTVDNYQVTVVEVKGFRIVRLLVTPIAPRSHSTVSA